MRKLASIIALAVALALPVSALAVSSGGSTSETLTGPATTVSITVPASTTYTLNGAKYDSAAITISNVTTNAPNGLHVDMTTSAFAGAASVPTTTRSRDVQTCPSGWSGSLPRAAGFYATSATNDSLCSRANPPASPASFDIVMHTQASDFTVQNGVYTGSLSITVTTNP